MGEVGGFKHNAISSLRQSRNKSLLNHQQAINWPDTCQAVFGLPTPRVQREEHLLLHRM